MQFRSRVTWLALGCLSLACSVGANREPVHRPIERAPVAHGQRPVVTPPNLGGGAVAVPSPPVSPRSQRKLADGELEWTPTDLGRLPLQGHREAELDRREAFVARLDGRIVWLDLSKREGLALIGKVDGPVTFRLAHLHDAWVLKTIDRLSRRFPVGLSYFAESFAPGPLAKLTALQMLEAGTYAAYPAPLRALRSMRGLRTLAWSGKVPAADAKILGELTQLRVLDVRLTDLYRGPLVDVAKLTELQDLDIELVSDRQLRELTPLKQLRRLKISGHQLSDAGMGALTEFPELRELHAVFIGAKDPSFLAKLPQLEVLGLPKELDRSAVPYINGLRNLRELDLFQAKFYGSDVLGLELPALESLKFRNTPGAIAHFASYRTLQRLEIESSPLSPSEVEPLKRLPRLQHLSIKVEASAVRVLAECPALESLNLAGGATDQELEALHHLQTLRRLELKWSRSTTLTACDQFPELLHCVNRIASFAEGGRPWLK
ncbi:MAG: hypothetical protein H6716_27320 [Polyangiaceae bacterium]|nr:hypothetical protein [Polyangiaceae bacterium]